MIDLRSDTVTRPTQPMLAAMMHAEVGDDVFNEDPTIHVLEHYAANLFGMDAALFCPSGTMTNQIAIRLHTRPGGEVICDQYAHIYNYEGGGIAVNSLCSVSLQQGERGLFTAADVAASIRRDDVHHPVTSLVAVENTMNRGGGACYNFAELRAIREVCDQHQIPLHLDGARLFNALVAKDEQPKDYGRLFDTVSICLSKGLGAPVGSLLLGKQAHIRAARRIRKVMGGGMRQGGFLAAAGLYGLQHNIERLADDHRRARLMADALSNMSCIEAIIPPETNIVIATLKKPFTPDQALNVFKTFDILAVPFGSQEIRFVTHLDFGDDQLDAFIQKLPDISRAIEQA